MIISPLTDAAYFYDKHKKKRRCNNNSKSVDNRIVNHSICIFISTFFFSLPFFLYLIFLLIGVAVAVDVK